MKRILFITSGSHATDVLVKNTLSAAEIAGVEMKFEIADEAEGLRLYKQENFDILLLSPLLRFLLNEKGESEIPKKSPIEVVENTIYGSLNGEGLFKLVMSKL